MDNKKLALPQFPFLATRLHQSQSGPNEGGDWGDIPPCLVKRKGKIVLKMHENVSNFKKFSPAAPIGTAGTILF